MELSCAGWASGPVIVAETFRQRWRGLRPAPGGRAMMFRSCSVHGFGMRSDLLVIGLDDRFTVISVLMLRPRRMIWLREARWILEMPPEATPPPVGSRLRPVP